MDLVGIGWDFLTFSTHDHFVVKISFNTSLSIKKHKVATQTKHLMITSHKDIYFKIVFWYTYNFSI